MDNKAISFGLYPQSKINDEKVIAILNNMVKVFPNISIKNWTKYDDCDYMWYIDQEYNGIKYRGVYFTLYKTSFQENNGYFPKQIYWFKFEPIKWLILKEDGQKLFLLSEKALDTKPFQSRHNNSREYVKNGAGYENEWKFSSIRNWLNNIFLDAAFNTKDQFAIEETPLHTFKWIKSEKISSRDKENFILDLSGIKTIDYVFLLSSLEIKELLPENSLQRNKIPTDYAQCLGAFNAGNSNYNHCCYWWLRDPWCRFKDKETHITERSKSKDEGEYKKYVYSVSYDGKIIIDLDGLEHNDFCVVPAIIISEESLKKQ